MRRMIVAALAAVTLMAGALPAAAADELPSIVDVATADGNQFDRNSWDFDIVTEAIIATGLVDTVNGLGAENTVFLPYDAAFRRLVWEATGKWYWSEKQVFDAAVDALGVDAIRNVVLYHVVPGAAVDYKTALANDGLAVGTALSPDLKLTIDVKRGKWLQIDDLDTNDRDAFVPRWAADIETSQGFIHPVTRVLRPIDLP